MGLFKKIKEFLAFRKALKKSIEEFEKQNAVYLTLTTEGLKELPEEELFSAVWARTYKRVDELEDFRALPEKQRIFYAVNLLEAEVNNGGLCQFFVNSSREVAPYISEYLGVIGAMEHKELFDNFIEENQIDVNDLTSFICEDVEEFSEQTERYPFDDYDDAFYELEPLEEYLTSFIKNNIDEF